MIQTTLISNIEPGCIFYIIKDYNGEYIAKCFGKGWACSNSYKSATEAIHALADMIASLKGI